MHSRSMSSESQEDLVAQLKLAIGAAGNNPAQQGKDTLESVVKSAASTPKGDSHEDSDLKCAGGS